MKTLLGILSKVVSAGLLVSAAAVAALGYVALLPLFPGYFAFFNVPYPAWYTAAACLGVQLAIVRHLERGGLGLLLAAGVLAGIAFTFKPNAGILCLLASGTTLALLGAGRGDRDRWWAGMLLALGGLTVPVLLAEAVAGAWLYELFQLAGAKLAVFVCHAHFQFNGFTFL